MTDYNDLIQRLISEANDTKCMLGHASSLHTAAADAIEKLVAERDNLNEAFDAQTRLWQEQQDIDRERAEKAEADLAAARKALRDYSKGDLVYYAEHAPAIAAARAEKIAR